MLPMILICAGSSPRTWGTPDRRDPHLQKARFIPTHVGNTTVAAAVRHTLAVHPHARGEHTCKRVPNYARFGSSPRTWGTQSRWRISILKRRFIPTHVGNTCTYLTCSAEWAVHPHARGEHFRKADSNVVPFGSSPRTWGTHPARWHEENGYRFIPTHVGNTLS